MNLIIMLRDNLPSVVLSTLYNFICEVYPNIKI